MCPYVYYVSAEAVQYGSRSLGKLFTTSAEAITSDQSNLLKQAARKKTKSDRNSWACFPEPTKKDFCVVMNRNTGLSTFCGGR